MVMEPIDLLIPREMDGHEVVSIAFHGINGERIYRYSIQTITIPETVSVMGKDAIYDCKALTAVYVKKGSYAESWLKDNGFSAKIQYIE